MSNVGLTEGLRETLAVFDTDTPGTPLTTNEVAGALDVGRRSTYNRLQQLVDAGYVETKEVGARGRVWWRPPGRTHDDGRPTLDTFFSRIDHALFALDLDWTITYLNEQAADFLDRSRTDVLGERVWDAIPAVQGERPQELAERAIETQEPITFDYHYDPTGRWFEAQLYPDETGLSAYLRDVTAEKEREQELEQYATILETIDDGVYVVDPSGEIVFTNSAYAEMTGYDQAELVGMDATDLVDEPIVDRARAVEEELLTGERETARLEADVRRVDGETFRGEATFSMVELADGQPVRIGVVRDVTERNRRERALERHRARLDALNDLNRVVHDSIDAVLDQSTRQEVERAVCDALASADSYSGAWIGALDTRRGIIEVRTQAGIDVAASGPYDADTTAQPDCPTARALDEDRVVVERTDPDAPEADRNEVLESVGAAAAVAIPVTHEDTTYGALTIYSNRSDAFTADEAEVVDHLGEVVGHAIAAIQRKRALLSDEVVELEFHVDGIGESVGLGDVTGRITFDRLVPNEDGVHLAYGHATDEAPALLDALVDELPHWASVDLLEEAGGAGRFEARLVKPPVLSTVTELGGYVEHAFIEDGDYQMWVHLAPSANPRRVIDAVTDVYENAELVTRRQRTRRDPGAVHPSRLLGDVLTDRQQTVLDAAYSAGYFESPRKRSGEHLADTLDIAAPTFHQHLRKAQQRLLEAVLDDRSRDWGAADSSSR